MFIPFFIRRTNSNSGSFRGIDRLLAEGEESSGTTAGDYQRKATEKDAAVLDRIAAAQREELERERGELKAEAERRAAEVEELAGRVPF